MKDWTFFWSTFDHLLSVIFFFSCPSADGIQWTRSAFCLWGCIWLDRNIERQYGKHMGIYNSWCLGDVILLISVILELFHYACCFSRAPLIKHTQTEMKKAPGWCWELESKRQIKKWWNRGEKGSGGILLFAGSVIRTTSSDYRRVFASIHVNGLSLSVHMFRRRVLPPCLCRQWPIPFIASRSVCAEASEESVSDRRLASVSNLPQCKADDIVKEGSRTNGVPAYVIIPNGLFNGYIWNVYMQLQ